jgi:hypothetical protein
MPPELDEDELDELLALAVGVFRHVLLMHTSPPWQSDVRVHDWPRALAVRLELLLQLTAAAPVATARPTAAQEMNHESFISILPPCTGAPSALVNGQVLARLARSRGNTPQDTQMRITIS